MSTGGQEERRTILVEKLWRCEVVNLKWVEFASGGSACFYVKSL